METYDDTITEVISERDWGPRATSSGTSKGSFAVMFTNLGHKWESMSLRIMSSALFSQFSTQIFPHQRSFCYYLSTINLKLEIWSFLASSFLLIPNLSWILLLLISKYLLMYAFICFYLPSQFYLIDIDM